MSQAPPSVTELVTVQKPWVALESSLAELATAARNNGDAETAEVMDTFARSVLKAAEVPEGLWRDNPTSGLFDKSLTRKTQRFVAVCLLRLLASNNNLFRGDFGIKTFHLFDNCFSGDLYLHLKLEKKQQKYQKEDALKEVVIESESTLATTVSSLTNLEMLHNYRTTYMKKINDQVSKAIIWPFLPRHLLEVRLADLFTTVEQYLQENGQRALQLYQRAKETISQFIADADACGTQYSRAYLGGLARQLLQLLQSHFESSPISEPAKLVVERSEKKYPLYEIGKGFNLGFVLSNNGLGHAFDVLFSVEATDLTFEKPEIYLGHMEPMSVVVEVPARVASTSEQVLTSVRVQWINFDRTQHEEEFLFELHGQPTHIDWDRLSTEEPYSLEPVENDFELVGRREILEQSIALAKAKSIGSSYLFGQKRVGKTSAVKTIKTRLESLFPNDYLIIYFERGDYISTNPASTVQNLGRRICHAIKNADNRFRNLEAPVFTDGLSPLTEFLDNVLQIAPNYRILFILDEFDELPVDLYKREPIGDAFFGTIRSISGKPPFGFILVGGENMEFIMSLQGHALNKFQSIRVDYFNKEEHWSDFQTLVRRPVAEFMEISDDALVAIYEQTAGNPFFTKLICARLFKMMVERRDSHVTRDEVLQATKRTLQKDIANNKVQHFWSDGIFETGIRLEEVSVRRRKVLLCLADAIRQQGVAEKQSVIKQGAEQYGIDSFTLDSDLREFQRRQILVERDGNYDFKVALFREWLRDSGINDIITTFSDPDAALRRKRHEEEIRIRSEEIVRLTDQWGLYLGQRITEDKVRCWLEQFGAANDQRLMFRILQNIKFYTADTLRSKMREAHGIVVRGLVHRIERDKRKRSDVLISYLDSLGKSGAYYAKLYADENEIYYSNVVERVRLSAVVGSRDDLQALVFIDDFLGTGNQAAEHCRNLDKECGDVLREKKLRMYFISICGFQNAKAVVQGVLDGLDLPIKVHTCDPLDEPDRCFSDVSKIFPNPAERAQAKDIVDRYGVRLVNSFPLGYGHCQATVVFENSCPNNTLPVLWSESGDWIPLFKRI
jgi:hypothetical protein